MIVAQVFLEAMEGCHLLLGPLFVMQTAIFGICPSAVVQIFAAVCFKESRPLVPSAIVGRLSFSFLRPVSTVSGRFSLWRLTAARSLRALNRSSFSWLLSVARLFAATSRIARKRRSLSCPVSPAHFRAACFPLVPRRFSLCSFVSTARLAALLSRRTFNRFSRSSLDSWDSLAKTRLRSAFNRFCLSAALVAATFWRAVYHVGRYTHITRQSSALHAPLFLTRPPLQVADIPT